MSVRTVVDLGVLTLLCLLGVLGFETSFGEYDFLLAGLGGLLVGTGVVLAANALRLGLVVTVLAGIVGYFLLGTLFAMPGEGILAVLPSLRSLAGLAIGAVHGWADIVTLAAPVEAPYYMPVLPYVSTWLVALVGTLLVTRWLPRRPRTVWRSGVLLVGPIALYVVGILLGTDEAYLAAVRGISFAVVALVWLGWRSSGAERADAAGSARLLRGKLVGTAVVVVGAALVGALVGAAVAPPSSSRFVLRDEIEPPFDPLQFPSPLAGFRKYTKDLVDTTLFTVSGLQPGESIRMASMDSYDGKLWNVAGPEEAASGAAGFSLIGRTVPPPPLLTPSSMTEATVEIEKYSDVWLPFSGYPSRIDFQDGESRALAETVRYRPDSGTGVLTGGLESGFRFNVLSVQQASVSDDALADVPVAEIAQPSVQDLPDIVVAKAVEFSGEAETPIAKLRAIEQRLKTQGFLSHGLASDAVPSRAGHGADRMIELFTRTQMVGDQEQYASAMALMARDLGYPARVVMGFAPDIPDGGGTVGVVGDDVTAWVEIAFLGVGWVPFYPTPDQTDVPQDLTPKPKTEPQPQVRQPPRTDNRSDELLTAVETDDSDKDDRKPPFAIPGWVWAVTGIVGIPLLLLGVPLLAIAALKKRRRARRRGRGSGDRRVAGAWDELTDGYAELGFEVPRGRTRRQVALSLEGQLHEQGVGDSAPLHTDTGPVRAVEGSAAPGTAIRLVPIAAEIDAAVFGGDEVADESVSERWNEVEESLGIARRSAGRTRRMIARFRIRSQRDWRSVNVALPGRSGSAASAGMGTPADAAG
ncbi:transglutaminase-like domain-containing protein [Luethyella okanaganae]|uniref:Transglutaminase family protein n=1 Tax=Luethyella okanaganae TaxID=69372 RepID=A0ABW1VB47_9MICO